MTALTRTIRWGAMSVAASAVLHIAAFALSGFSGDILWVVPAALILSVLAFALARGQRWAAYAAFLTLLIGTSFAASTIWAFGGLVGWLFAAIAIVNVVGALALFGALWRAPKAAG